MVYQPKFNDGKKIQLKNKNYVVAKLKLIDNMLGIEPPTLCGYSTVYGKINKNNLHIWTICTNLFAIKIHTHMIHHSFS